MANSGATATNYTYNTEGQLEKSLSFPQGVVVALEVTSDKAATISAGCFGYFEKV